MSYNVDWKSGGTEGIPGKTTIVLPERTVDTTSTSLALTGKKTANYGEIQQENFIKLLENFASNTAPANPTIGQLWFSPVDKALYLCVETSTVEADTTVYFESGLIGWVRAWEATALGTIVGDLEQSIIDAITAHTNELDPHSQYLTQTEADGRYSLGADAVILTGDQTIDGVKTFSSTIAGSVTGNAGTVTNGVYTTGNQTVGGIKTFSSDMIVSKTNPLVTAYHSGTNPSNTNLFNVDTSFGVYDAQFGGLISKNKSTGYVSLDAPVFSPSFAGVPTAPTAPPGTNSTQLANTEFVQNAVGGTVLLTGNQSISGNKTFTGGVFAPTPPSWSNDTTVATTSFVQTVVSAATLGVGQVWQEVSRAPDVVYQNTFGRTIFITISGTGSYTQLFVGSNSATSIRLAHNNTDGIGPFDQYHISAPIPQNWYYKITGSFSEVRELI